jgi:phosphoglycerol transferase MdoB-like AlkP superfamily enzyme
MQVSKAVSSRTPDSRRRTLRPLLWSLVLVLVAFLVFCLGVLPLDYWPRFIALLFLILLCGPSVLATAHLMLFTRETTMKKMRLATRFLIGLDAISDSWRYLVRGGRLD